MANGNGSTTTVQQIVADPDFGKLSAQDQQSVLAHFDTDFGKLSTNELLDVVTALQKLALARPDLARRPGPCSARRRRDAAARAQLQHAGPESTGRLYRARTVPGEHATGTTQRNGGCRYRGADTGGGLSRRAGHNPGSTDTSRPGVNQERGQRSQRHIGWLFHVRSLESAQREVIRQVRTEAKECPTNPSSTRNAP